MGGNRIHNPLERVVEKPWTFAAAFIGVFFLFSVVLFAFDFYPEPVKSGEVQGAATTTPNTENAGAVQYPVENPVRIVIKDIGIDTPIQNPTSTGVEALDEALLKGAARYPQSALLGENARMFIFGHQSYLPIIHNQAFKAFNGLQKLKGGEEITVFSGTAEYHYRVTSVLHKSAADALIELGAGARTLTLSTCDSFGQKTDRYVVTAEFVSREEIIQTNS